MSIEDNGDANNSEAMPVGVDLKFKVYWDLLQTKLAEREKSFTASFPEFRQGNRGTRSSGDADGDDATDRNNINLSTTNIENLSNTIKLIKEALVRIKDGSYGVCIECEEDIHEKRLKAVPEVAYCIKCQEEKESQQILEKSSKRRNSREVNRQSDPNTKEALRKMM